MATCEDLHRIALSLPGTSVGPHFDRTAYKVVRTYVTLASDGNSANIKFTPDHQEFKCMMAPDVYRPIPNAWGRRGWTVMDLGKLTEAELETDLKAAYIGGAAKKTARRSRKPG